MERLYLVLRTPLLATAQRAHRFAPPVQDGAHTLNALLNYQDESLLMAAKKVQMGLWNFRKQQPEEVHFLQEREQEQAVIAGYYCF